MKIRTFIDRPILAGVISVVILILGLIGLVQLPIEQFPEIAPPTVSVSATYTGANAETVLKSVVVPLEEALNGVENMMYMTSTSANTGQGRIVVYFRQGTDPDMATVNVQNRIATAQGVLPAEVTKSGITVRKRQTSNIKILSLYSPDDSFDEAFLNNYLKINIEPRLARIAGVGEVNVMGYDYSLRIWLDPNKMMKYGLMPSDITAILNEQNVEAATGTLGAESDNTFQYVLKYRGRYEQEVDYEELVIKALPSGEVLRLKDVATIELGSMGYSYIGEMSGHPGCNIMISQTSGSNANEIIEEIDRLEQNVSLFLEVNMGATAIGTGINADPEYSQICIKYLREITGFPIQAASNMIEATNDTGAFVMYSSAVKRLAVKLSKICSDLRLLSSGPRTGLNEINLPPRQPGSSIMPGKVNPVIPEVVNQVAFSVIGNDLTITLASEAGQLELNVMEPIIVHSLFENIEMLVNAMNTLREKCIVGITANPEVCRRMVYNSIGLVTALNPYLGYETSTMLAKEALQSGKGIYDLVLEHKLMSEEELQKILQPENMVHPRKKITE